MNISEQTPYERREMLLEYIRKHGSASVHALSGEFYLHEATVRRDLNTMAEQGLITRIRGGAAVTEESESEIPLFVRETQFRNEKQHIAAKAAKLVRDGNSLFIDSSSTAAFMIRHLRDRRGLRIVTDGIRTCMMLAQLPGAEIFTVGGRLRGNSLSIAGSIALEDIARFHFDAAFFSCRGVDINAGLTDTSEEEALFRKCLIEHSERSILLADHSKLEHVSFYTVAPISELSAIVTDGPIPAGWDRCGVEMI